MLLNEGDLSKLSHRVNNFMATLTLCSDILLENDDEEMRGILARTVKEMSRFWAYVNFLYRNKSISANLEQGVQEVEGLPKPLDRVFAYELIQGGIKLGAKQYSIEVGKSQSGKQVIVYRDNGPGFREEVIKEIGSIQQSGSAGCGLGLLVIFKLAEQNNFRFVLEKNCAKLIEI